MLILYPWRYGDNVHSQVKDQRMRLSKVRTNLLALVPSTPKPQLTLEDAERSEEELALTFEEAKACLGSDGVGWPHRRRALCQQPQRGYPAGLLG